MTALGVAAILGAGGLVVFFVFTAWRHRLDLAELGTMSQQWRSDHRAHERYDSQR